jgi:hypothetical protein
MFILRDSIPFNAYEFKEFHNRFFERSERSHVPENFVENLIIYDAQWYLKIAREGYVKPTKKDFEDPSKSPNVLQFAFFPLYPLTLSGMYALVQNIELAAFVYSLILQIAVGISVFFVIKTIVNEKIALYTLLLLFFFPFSIFFRSYYTEALFLLLLSWFCFFTYKRQFSVAAVFLGLLIITRGTGMMLLPFFAFLLYRERKPLYIFLIAIAPLLLWIYHCYIKTGDPFMFATVKQYWLGTTFPLYRIIQTFAAFPFIPVHGFHASKIDSTMIVVIGLILYKSKKILHPLLWWISFCLWVTPILTHDTMSFCRYQSVNFPLFVYLASLMSRKAFILTASIFYILLVFVSILFLNYYWIG